MIRSQFVWHSSVKRAAATPVFCHVLSPPSAEAIYLMFFFLSLFWQFGSGVGKTVIIMGACMRARRKRIIKFHKFNFNVLRSVHQMVESGERKRERTQDEQQLQPTANKKMLQLRNRNTDISQLIIKTNISFCRIPNCNGKITWRWAKSFNLTSPKVRPFAFSRGKKERNERNYKSKGEHILRFHRRTSDERQMIIAAVWSGALDAACPGPFAAISRRANASKQYKRS